MYTDYPRVYDNGAQAIQLMRERSGSRPKELGMFLVEHGYWPPPPVPCPAATRYRACENPNVQDQTFRFAELVALMGYTGRFDPLYYACDTIGLQRPTPKPRGQEILELSNMVQDLIGTVTGMKTRIDHAVDRLAREESFEHDAPARDKPLRFHRGLQVRSLYELVSP